MSEELALTPFENFYRQVKSAYFIGCADTIERVQDIYGKESSRAEIKESLIEHLKDRLDVAFLLESSGLEGVVHELSELVLAMDHLGLGKLVGDSLEHLDYQELEDFQEYLQEGIDGEEDSERRDQLINAVRSLLGSQ